MSVLVLTILEKIKKTRLRFSEGRKSSLIRDDKLSRSKSWTNKYTTKKIQSTAKDNTGTILKKSNKNFWDEDLSHELFLTTKQKTKVRNALANNASTDTKLSQSQLAKIWRIS